MIANARKAAESEIEPLLGFIKQKFIETYVKGFIQGMETAEDKEAAIRMLKEETEAFTSGAIPEEEKRVRLEPNAILKRRIKKEEFSSRVWRTLKELNIETLGEILQVRETFYLRMEGFGVKSLKELREYVSQFGCCLKEK